jgi:hypothetical protein
MKLLLSWILASGICFFLSFPKIEPEWGFFGHKTVNKLAVFTLPPELIAFYKKHIDYISDHSVDPDKRRYAVPLEGPRHYIDLDHYGDFPFENLPRNWEDLVSNFTDIVAIKDRGDTLRLYQFSKRFSHAGKHWVPFIDFAQNKETHFLEFSIENWNFFVSRFLLPNYNRQAWIFSPLKLNQLLYDSLVSEYRGVDLFTQHGVLPYHLSTQYQMLVSAFRNKDIAKILRYSADIGHYIGDAHVPLHTTSNYNGQFTNQYGIHGFWESRLPELFAEKEYDFFVGKAKFIFNPSEFFWDITLESHSLVDSVLTIEKELSLAFPSDEKYCFEDRLGMTLLQPCFDYSKAYHEGLNGMIERRMRKTIHAIGSIWFTAWVESGQPKLEVSDVVLEQTTQLLHVEEIKKKEGTFSIRQHED